MERRSAKLELAAHSMITNAPKGPNFPLLKGPFARIRFLECIGLESLGIPTENLYVAVSKDEKHGIKAKYYLISFSNWNNN